MAGRQKNREERLTKQRDYQREYRRKMKESRKPDRNAIAQAFLYYALARSYGNDKQGEHLRQRVLAKVEQLLVELGYDAHATRSAVDELVERYESGWTFQRKLHQLSKADVAVAENTEGDVD